MFGAIDLLASEYGWSRDVILHDTYPDELFSYSTQIERRRLNEYIVQLRITTNPHLTPDVGKQLYEEFMGYRKNLYGAPVAAEKLDVKALDDLKDFLKNKSMSISVK